ncbi:MAG: tyrosine-type recombinase/integrase [Zetaproteobacteria bacterium]|nr:tyrosine-type recombinase/integrase [Zetaproteobacteria bacterium]
MSIRLVKLKSGKNRYKAIVTISQSKQISKNFERKADAAAWEREQRLHLSTDGQAITARSRTLLSGFVDQWLTDYAELNKSASSIQSDKGILRNHILPAFGHLHLGRIRTYDVELWLSALSKEKRLSPKTCNNCLGLFKKIFNDAIRLEFLAKNPAQSIRPLKLPPLQTSFLVSHEVSRFLKYLRENKPEYSLVYSLAVYCGLRRGEMRALKWNCVDFGKRLIEVRYSYCFVSKRLKAPKSNRTRCVPIYSSLMGILAREKARSGSEWVVNGFDFEHADRITRRWTQMAGVPSVRFHDLRHTFASGYAMSGGNLYELKELLGHSTIQMTERYSHLSEAHMMGKTEILNFESFAAQCI